MTHKTIRYLTVMGLAAAVWLWSGEIKPTMNEGLLANAEALIGRPVTPVSYAGVARRSTVRVGTRGAGVALRNRGGPVNRVGRR
jgi:hypothetical protein